MKYFSLISTLVKIERTLILLCLLAAIGLGWQTYKIKKQTLAAEIIIQKNLEKEFSQKIQQLPTLITTPASTIQLDQFNIFTKLSIPAADASLPPANFAPVNQ
ncbi:MAG: hypothetical protein NTV81_02665 [Candidatus Komeilibacteria bacterium]|nr:hypothetical protein [Candidatus Komeilibacteria bacterium]